MLKKIAVAALISSFAIASFAATETKADTKTTVAPAATEQKADTPKPAKHMKHHHKKAGAKTETPATK